MNGGSPISRRIVVTPEQHVWVWVDGSNEGSGPQSGPFTLTLLCL